MAVVGIIAILVPSILAGFMMGWIWLFFLSALVFVPLMFIERQLDSA
jgi:hypothetical protein